MYKQRLIDAKLKTGKTGQKTELGEVHLGGEVPHWTAVPSKKKKKIQTVLWLFIKGHVSNCIRYRLSRSSWLRPIVRQYPQQATNNTKTAYSPAVIRTWTPIIRNRGANYYTTTFGDGDGDG